MRRALAIGGIGLLLLGGVLTFLQLRAGFDGFIAGRVKELVRGRSAIAEAGRQESPPSYQAVLATAPAADPTLRIIGIGGSSTTAPVVTDHVLPVEITPPAGAVRMQLSTRVSFADAEWTAPAERVDVPVEHTGFQTVFARFELGDGSVTPTVVAGAVVDPTHRAATSSADGGGHQPSWVRPLSSTELVIRVEAGRLQLGALEAYDLDNPPDGDRVQRRAGGNVAVIQRDGEGYGYQVSTRTDVIRRADRLVGRPLDVTAATGDTWTISSPDDTAYADPVPATGLRHVARPAGGGLDAEGAPVFEVTHDFVLTVATPLTAGYTYQIQPKGTVAPTTFAFDPTVGISPAVRVNQVGFAPGDEPKVAYLSGWFDGIGGSAVADPPTTFNVITAGEPLDVVYVGEARPRPADSLPDHGDRDLTGSPVFELDFSALTTEGRYQVCVGATVGCSQPFVIDDDVWADLADTVARSAYHQRSGTAIGPPYTPVTRPRGYHPDDGVVVVGSDFTLLEARFASLEDTFAHLVDEATGETVADGWGGHFDAGDWDRRIYHLWYARTAAQLVDGFPDLFGQRDLDIPESGDAVPDLLDEALWSLDFYRRLQTEDGGIRGGIEASEHPPPHSTSWTDDLALYAFAPDPYSSYLYAGVAAEFSVVLGRYAPERADELLDSAIRAMTWAEANLDLDGLETLTESTAAEAAAAVEEQRAVAAAALLLATEDRAWHQVFTDATTIMSNPDPAVSCHAHADCDAGWLYLQVDPALTDSAIRDRIVERFRQSADAIVDAADHTAYGWTTENPRVPLIWGLGSGGAPHTQALLRAHLLTGDERYREAAVRSASVALGANPLNHSLITGVGEEPVSHAQIEDVKSGGLPLWAGTPVYGHHDLGWDSESYRWITDDVLAPAGAAPDPAGLPYLWQWYDVSNVAPFNEFTLHQSHSEALWTFGVLAATTDPTP